MSRILIVDDEFLNRELLHAYLDGHGHEILEADGGERALEVAAQAPPDLVICDVMMRGLDGFETTRRLKASAAGFLPIVLLTALTDHESRLTGLRAGADDFLSKPVDRLELLARITNLLALRSRDLALAARNEELMELQRFREEMAGMIVHDLKNPIAVMALGLRFLQTELADTASVDIRETLDDARSACTAATRIVSNILDVARAEATRLELKRMPVGVDELLTPRLRERTSTARARDIKMPSITSSGLNVSVDADLVGRVIENLLDNSLRHAPPGGRIDAWAMVKDERTEIRIGNSGPPIPEALRKQIFEKYGQRDAKLGRMNLGLGLYFCRLVAEAHGGSMWIEETPTLPAIFALAI